MTILRSHSHLLQIQAQRLIDEGHKYESEYSMNDTGLYHFKQFLCGPINQIECRRKTISIVFEDKKHTAHRVIFPVKLFENNYQKENVEHIIKTLSSNKLKVDRCKSSHRLLVKYIYIVYLLYTLKSNLKELEKKEKEDVRRRKQKTRSGSQKHTITPSI